MKEVAILLLLALMLNGCSSSTTNVQTAASGGWQASLSGGEGSSSGFSFITFFTVSGSNNALSISNFQLLNQEQDTCFGTSGISESGTLDVTFNSADQVTGTFSFTLTGSAGDTVTLTSTDVTGTLNTTNNTLSNGSITGSWLLTPGSGTGCVATSGPFTMTQSP